YALAAAFLLGVPMAAGPIAGVMPEPWRARVSDIAWQQLEGLADYCDSSDEAARILNDAAHRMMNAANVPDRDSIWIIIVDARDFLGQPIPNAFALPDGSIIVTDGLIGLAEHPDEVIGVIAHEIAHIERDHVMKNVISRLGAGVFFDVVFGGSGIGQAIAVVSVGLAGLRYSRGYEAEADQRALDFLDAAGVDPGGLARMFDHLRAYERGGADAEADAESQADGRTRVPSLLSTHPDSAERAERAPVTVTSTCLRA
ncbi:MAG TPA: M48 family metallopeptidase, partial [Terricaulis sp.]|nr:M48 family metallopeptidase [Terricaulis sp.]